MGTNYYFYPEETCQCCGRRDRPLHIGKSSFGWCFVLHVMPLNGISSLDDWIRLFGTPGSSIEDEYGRVVTVPEMMSIITDRGNSHIDRDWDSEWWHPYYRSESHFHESNSSIRGPKGLLRHKINRFCIDHGEGTWDYVVGEFS